MLLKRDYISYLIAVIIMIALSGACTRIEPDFTIGIPEDIPAIALDVPVERKALARAIAERLLRAEPFLEEYRSLCLTVGKTVTVHPVQGEPYEARALEIDHRCRLVVESCRGVETLDSGEVSVRF